MGTEPYSLKDVSASVGIPGRRIIDWVEKQVVHPDLGDTAGSGNPRLYSETNLLEFAVAKELVDTGVTIRRVADLLEFLRRETREEREALWGQFRALRFARMKDGSVKYAGSCPPGSDLWEFYGSDRATLGRGFDGAALWVIIDLDAVRSGLRERSADKPRRRRRR